MKGLVVWFTGLSGAGKTTIAEQSAKNLETLGFSTRIIDGDQLRRSRGRNLGYSAVDLMKSNRLAIETCKEMRDDFDILLVPRISPFIEARRLAREELGEGFIEVYVKASLGTVQKRDSKGMYEKALLGQIDAMIGMDGAVPYEIPINPDIVLDTESLDSQALVGRLTDQIQIMLSR